MPARAFSAYPGAVPAARAYVVALLDHLPADLQETAGLLVSELATNAIRHGSGQDFEVSVEQAPDEDRLRVGVTGNSTGNPFVHRPPVTAEHGRGLQLVGLLSDRWGVRRNRDDDVKTVWFELTGASPGLEREGPGRSAAAPAGRVPPRGSFPDASRPAGARPPGSRAAGPRGSAVLARRTGREPRRQH